MSLKYRGYMELQNIRRVIFCSGNGISRAPMAAGIFRELIGDASPIEVYARGLVVAFPEPLNQKTEAVLAANGITFEKFSSQELKNEEITDKTIVFTMEDKERVQILAKYDSANEENVYTLATFAGEELETMNPYGGSLQTYGLCFESLRNSLTKAIDRLERGTE